MSTLLPHFLDEDGVTVIHPQSLAAQIKTEVPGSMKNSRVTRYCANACNDGLFISGSLNYYYTDDVEYQPGSPAALLAGRTSCFPRQRSPRHRLEQSQVAPMPWG